MKRYKNLLIQKIFKYCVVNNKKMYDWFIRMYVKSLSAKELKTLIGYKSK